MLDIFGSVFGKSKKSSNSQQQASGGASGNNNGQANNDNSIGGETNDGYVFLQKPPYAQTTILTDELIRMGSSSSMMQTSTSVTASSSSNVYPALDLNATPTHHQPLNPNLPFSSLPPGNNSRSSMHNNRLSVTNRGSISTGGRNVSPIDNVPFSIINGASVSTSGPGGGGSPSTFGVDDDAEVYETLNRVQQFLSNANQSEYNFKLENSILRECL